MCPDIYFNILTFDTTCKQICTCFLNSKYQDSLYNLYKDSCHLIGWITFIILTIRWQNILLHSIWVGKSEKLFTIALIVHIYIRVFSISNKILGRLHLERG